MIFRCTNFIALALILTVLNACSSSSSGSSTSAGITVNLSATPSPANAAVMSAGPKVFMNDLGDTVTLTKAYLVIGSSTVETTCGASFSAAIDGLINLILPVANAHTTTTPTSTGEPYVVNLLVADNAIASIGTVSPPPGDYCGVTYDLIAADADAINLPVGAGEPEMIGRTLYIEGTYQLSGGGTGNVLVDTGSTLIARELELSALMMLSASNLNGSVDIGINYDTWFNGIGMGLLEAGDLGQVNQMLINVTDSIKQL